MFAFVRRHRVYDGLCALPEALVEIVDLHLTLDVAEARNHVDELGERAHLLDALKLHEEVVEVELLRLHALLERLDFVFGDGILGALDEAEHVPHAENPRGEAVRIEGLESV